MGGSIKVRKIGTGNVLKLNLSSIALKFWLIVHFHIFKISECLMVVLCSWDTVADRFLNQIEYSLRVDVVSLAELFIESFYFGFFFGLQVGIYQGQ